MTDFDFPVFPDVELVVVRWLKAAGFTCSTALPSSPSWPYVTVSRIGGGADPSTLAFDRARVQVDVWGSSKAEASNTIRAVMAALFKMRDSSPDAEVSDVRPDGGMSWMPDDSVQPARPRYVAGVLITLR